MRDATGGGDAIIGRRFGSWVVVRDSAVGGTDRRVTCRCDCGNSRSVSLKNLLRGQSRSCGRCTSARHEELQARLAGVRASVAEMMPAGVKHATVALHECDADVLAALEAAGGRRAPDRDYVALPGDRVSLIAHLKGTIG